MDANLDAALREPFDPAQVGHLPKVVCPECREGKCGEHKRTTCKTCKGYLGKHVHIDYVGHAHVTERLLSVDPEWNWEPLAFSGNGMPAIDDNGGLWIRLTIGGVTRIGYGDAPGKRGAVKELIGDAIRNASMRFGVALDLWKKEAPAPVSDVVERPAEQPTLTPAERATQLRSLIAAIGKKAGKKVELIGADFFEWSQGKEISQASVAVLAEYKAHLDRGTP